MIIIQKRNDCRDFQVSNVRFPDHFIWKEYLFLTDQLRFVIGACQWVGVEEFLDKKHWALNPSDRLIEQNEYLEFDLLLDFLSGHVVRLPWIIN